MYDIRIHGNSIDRGILGSNSDFFSYTKRRFDFFLKKLNFYTFN